MNTTIEALQNLYTALGGTASEVAEITTIPDMINAIAGLGAIKAGGALNLDSAGDLTITAPNCLYMRANGDSEITVTNGALSIEGTDGMQMQSNGDIYIETENNGEINIIADSALRMESNTNIVNITADSDVDIISRNSEITIDAQGANLTLKGDEVTANGKAVLTED